MVENWIEQYRALDGRFETMKKALQIVHEVKDPYIVETGTTRMKDDWGAGMSTLIFGSYCKTFGGHVVTIDIDKDNIEMCKQVTSEFAPFIEYIVSDSLVCLPAIEHSIDLLYLDSFDYPYGELLNLYGGKEDIHAAIKMVDSFTEEFIVQNHGEIIEPAQKHQVKELELALPRLKDTSIILLDDNQLPGGGKTRLTKLYLKDHGWKEVLGGQQSLWQRSSI